MFDFLADRARAEGQGHDRPRRRPDHHLARRGRRRRAREAAHLAGRALPHAARPFPPRGRSLLLGPAGARRWRARKLPRAVRRRDARTTTKRCSGTTRTAPPPNWQENYVSAYATMHPWEDFAETWAHYLHIVDTLEMAHAFGISIVPARRQPTKGLSADCRSQSLQGEGRRDADRGLAAADLRGEQSEPQHGAAGPLPVRHLGAGDRQAAVHPRSHSRHAAQARRCADGAARVLATSERAGGASGPTPEALRRRPPSPRRRAAGRVIALAAQAISSWSISFWCGPNHPRARATRGVEECGGGPIERLPHRAPRFRPLLRKACVYRGSRAS